MEEARVRQAEQTLKEHGWGAKTQSDIRLGARRAHTDPDRAIVLASIAWPMFNRLRKCAVNELDAVVLGPEQAQVLLTMIATQIPNKDH